MDLLPYWEGEQTPDFYKRTEVQYHVSPLTQLQKRGIYDTTLTNFAAHLPAGAILAGGYVASVLNKKIPASDIDIFFTGAESFIDTYNLLVKPPNNPSLTGYTPNISEERLLSESKLLRLVKFTNRDPSRLPIQLIKMVWYDSAEAVIDSFDFTATQFAVHNSNLVFSPLGLSDLMNQRLVLHRQQYPADTLFRMMKYAKKGFTASPMSLNELVESIKECQYQEPPFAIGLY